MNTISGNLIKGYQLKERIGAGGFGAVYRAEQSSVGREVAIKVILPGYANQPDFIRRFETEAQLVARLEHMHIVPLYDYWRDPDGAYLVMRLLRGGSLQSALQSGPYDLESAAALLDQVSAGLMMAHRNQIVHRDIKPSNILLDEDGNAYLTDFGIAKVLNMGATIATDPGGITGSPDYLAPEQARDEEITPRTDIYSMGVVLYEMLTGEHPFKEAAAIERLFHHINDPLPQIAGLEPDVTEDINKVIQKATTKNPEDRYRDIIELATAFREAAGLSVSQAARNIVELLTPREQEVLKLIIEGRSNREIADELVIETSTVKWYVRQIYKKLNVRSRVQAIVKARELNLIVDDFILGTLDEIPEPENPYKGLNAFQAIDEKDFHGRERLIQKLLSRMDGDEDHERFLAVVGPSGSGKSSLVKAGLIPALWRGEAPGSDNWYIVEMIPTGNPLEELETALIRIAAEHGSNIGEYLRRSENGLSRIPGLILPDDGSQIVVVIDQFEELFTLVENEAERQYFLDLLVKAVTGERSRIRVVITLRADFYDRPLRYAEFGQLLHNRVETVLPLSADELEQAIVEPARQVGVLYEDGLVPLIIDEMLYQPGMLPLLQYALTELFEVREEHMLTLDGYQQIGGALGALGKRAEEIYLELDPEGQELVRQMFLRLVTLGEGVEDTRRRTAQAELLGISQNPDLADEIIDTFAAYRLFSLDHDPETRAPVVEVAHEAILREWERLAEWLDRSRDDIRQGRQLSRAARDWERSGKEDSFLLRGARLEGFEAWREVSELSLTAVEADFLEASSAAWDREQAEVAERAAREKALEQRSRTILRALVGVFAAATIVTLILAIFAFQQRGSAQENAAAARAEAEARSTQQAIAEDEAQARATQQLVAEGEAEARATQQAIAEANEAEALAQKAIVEELAMEAQRQAELNKNRFLVAESQIALQGNNYDLALALANEAIQIKDPPAAAELAFAQAAYSGGIYPARDFSGHEDEIYGLGFPPDGRSLVTVALDNTIRQWDLTTGEQIEQVDIPGGQIDGWYGAAVSPDGSQALAALEDLSLVLVDVESGDLIHRMAGHDGILMIKFSPDGKTALTGAGRYDMDFSMRLWDLETGKEMRRFEGHSESVQDGIFMPDGRSVLSASHDGSLIRWDLETGEILQQMVNESGELIGAVAITPDGRWAIANEDFKINLWDLESGQMIGRLGTHNVYPLRMAVSPDGRMGVSGDVEGEIRIWDLVEGKKSLRFQGHSEPVTLLAFSEDGQHLFSGGRDKLRMWSLKNGAEVRRFEQEGLVRGVAYSPDGRTAISLVQAGVLHLWDLESGGELRRIELPGEGWDVAYTPDGSSALVGFVEGDVIQYDLSTGAEIKRLGGEDENDGHVDAVTIAVSQDEATILTGSHAATTDDRHLFFWNLENGAQLQEYDVPEVFGLDISPDGGRALLVGSYGLIELDLETGEEIRLLNEHENYVWDVAYTPDGKRALTSSWDSTLILWDLESGEIIHRLRGHFDHVRPVDIHPDGRTAISGSRDGTLILWDLERGEEIRRYLGHNAQINDVAFSPDGQYALSSDSEGVMIEWRIDDTLEELVAWAEANRSLRELTCTEREQFNIEPLCD